MRKTREVQVGDRKITVNELTVAQVDALFSGFDAERPAHKAELLMESALPIEAVQMATGMTAEQLSGDICPSELAEIWQAVAEVNDFLSRLLGRMAQAGKEILAAKVSGARSAG